MKGSKRRNMQAGAVITVICVIVIVIFVVSIVINSLKAKSSNQKETKDIGENVSETISVGVEDDVTKNSKTDMNTEKESISLPQETTKETTKEATKETKKEAATTQAVADGTVVGKSSKGYDIVVKDGVTYVNGIMIVNKTYALPSTYNPGELLSYVSEAFEKMKADASSLGLNIWNQSGFRTYERQQTLYNNYVARDGKALADTYSARPGHSEHQSGLCFDLNTITDAFADTNEGKWVAAHAHEYGFIIRFPKGKENVTGYKYESWHLRYVGKDIAKQIYESGECLEEYLGVSSVYKD